MKRTILFLLTLLLSNSFINAQIDSPIVLTYFPSWSENWAEPNQSSKLRDIPSYINYVFLAFAKPDLSYTKGSYDLSGTGIQVPYDGCTLKESISALKDKGTEVILSVGGETYWNDANIYNNINYQEIKDLVDDLSCAGIDWDFEPDGSFSNIGSPENVQHFIDFFNNSRALMPRSEGYILACAPSGVGALGGGNNNDVNSPFAYSKRNEITGEDDANLWSATTPTNGISLFGFGATGHMIPVIESVGDKIDIIALQGYNVGASTNRQIMYDAYAYYANTYGFNIAAGVHFPEEPWGPYYTYLHSDVAAFAQHVKSHPLRGNTNDGIMIWELLLSNDSSSAFSYMNVASKVLNGMSETTAISQANDYTMNTYTGGSVGCDTNGNGSGTYCGTSEYDASSSYATPGTRVYAHCKIWENQWFANPGEAPISDAVWLEIEGCSDDPNCIVNIKTPEPKDINIRLVEGKLIINGIAQTLINEVKVIDIQGKILSHTNNKCEIDIKNLAKGMYIIQISIEKNVLSKQFIKN